MDSEIFGPNGELRDFEGRPGDPRPPGNILNAAVRRRWGNRVLLSTDTVTYPKARNTATFVDTGDVGRTAQFNTQFRFALDNGLGSPILPFSYVNPTRPPGTSLNMTIRRGVDSDAPLTIDPGFMDLTKNDTAPFDTVPGRSLGIDIQLVSTGAVSALWIEVMSTVVDDQSRGSQLESWGTQVSSQVVAANVASVQLLPSHFGRAQFIIVNTSTNADLWISFGGTPVVNGNATLVLPRNIFASYESPIGGFRGIINGIWSAGATGSALCTEGLIY